jgi:diaminopimelate decarboxylase
VVEMSVPLKGSALLSVLENLDSARLPALVYSESVVSQLTTHFLEAISPLRPFKLLYAAKAGSFPRLLQVLQRGGVEGFDASSPAEAALIRQSFPWDVPIYVTAPALTKEEMMLLRLLKPACIHVDSTAGLELALKYLPDIPLGVRVNPGVTDSNNLMTASGRSECRLGIPIDDLPRALSIARSGGVHEIGIHFHVACEAASFDVHARAVTVISTTLARCAAPIPAIKHLDIGGGVAPPRWDHVSHNVISDPWMIDALEAAVARFRAEHRHRLTSDFRILLEPGDALVGPAAVLIAAVIERRLTAQRQEHWILNTNINHFPFLLTDGDVPPVLWPPEDPNGRRVVLSGNSCLAGDEIASINVDSDATRVVFGSRGSYEYGRMTLFNGRFRPRVLFQDEAGRISEARSDSLTDVSLLWGTLGAPPPGTWFTVEDVEMPGLSWQDAAMALPASVARRIITRHTSAGGTVLDPFAGFGTAIRVADDSERIGVGIEVDRQRWLHANTNLRSPHRIIHGDAATVPLDALPEADLLLTSPPHWVPESNALAGYTGASEPYALYLEHLVYILVRIAERVRPNGVIAMVVANMRYRAFSAIPFAFDLTAALARRFTFIGEEIACFTVPELDAGEYGNHQYCIQFRKEPQS